MESAATGSFWTRTGFPGSQTERTGAGSGRHSNLTVGVRDNARLHFSIGSSENQETQGRAKKNLPHALQDRRQNDPQ